MDGEDDVTEAAAVEAHLAGCPPCADWRAAAENLTRRLRVQAAFTTPDFTARVLAATPPRRAPVWPRAALLVVAVLQLGIALSQLLGSITHAGHAGPGHLFNEGVAWNIAVGVALLMVCVRPGDARGLLTPLTTFAALLALYTTVDLVASSVTIPRALSHLPLVAGLVLLFLIKRHSAGEPEPRRLPVATDEPTDAHTWPDPDERTQRGPRPLRPTAQHRAA